MGPPLKIERRRPKRPKLTARQLRAAVHALTQHMGAVNAGLAPLGPEVSMRDLVGAIEKLQDSFSLLGAKELTKITHRDLFGGGA